MAEPQIWHNPRCGTSRHALGLLEAAGRTPRIRLYLVDTPDAFEIGRILKMMRARPEAIVRLKDAPPDAAAAWAKAETDEARIAALVANPILIQRPIVITGRKAALVRPTTDAEAILKRLGL